MAKYVNCPFYRYDTGQNILCEGKAMHFNDRGVLKRYRARYCGHIKDWKECRVARELLKKYEEE